MIDVKLQFGCLTIMLYIIYMYAKETKDGKIPCNPYYDKLLCVAPWAVFFDGVTYWTVNHMNEIPRWVNVISHLLFFVLMDLTIIFSAIYMYDQIMGFKGHKLAKKILMFAGLLSLCIIVADMRNVQFLKGEKTNYSLGLSVYMCFATVFIYYAFILYLIIHRRKYLPKAKRLGTTGFILIMGILLVLQLVFSEFLISSISPTLLVLGMYIVFENPSIRKLEVQNENMIESFATLVESRDDNTGGHIKRTRLYVKLLLRKMQHDSRYEEVMTRDYITYVSEAAPLHDIGKISTPDAILQKPGKLTDEEYAIMKEHAARGGDIILHTFSDMNSKEAKQIAYEVARYHHEKYNGKGYPDGLAGTEIPLHARVMAIADVFDAIFFLTYIDDLYTI